MFLTKKTADQLASDLTQKRIGQNAKVGSHTTNGEVRHVVHVTFDHGQAPYTIS